MLVWIVRHGKAEPQAPDLDDWVRRLVPRGERQIQHVALAIAARPDRPTLILASPVTRAAQTARLIQRVLDVPLRWSAHLETERPISAAIDTIRAHADAPSLMLVGHNMQLSDLVATLARPPADASELRTGEAILLDWSTSDHRQTASLLARLRHDD